MCDHLNSTLYMSEFTVDLLDSGKLDISYDNDGYNIYESTLVEINYCPICGEPIKPNERLHDYAIIDNDDEEIMLTIAGVYEKDAVEALEDIVRDKCTSASLARFTLIADAREKVVVNYLK